MNIVILDADPAFGSRRPDGSVVGPLGSPELAALGALTLFDSTPPEQVIERASNADVIVTNKVVLDRDVFAALPRLKLVSVLATGVNVVDLFAAREYGVMVCNVPGYSSHSTAQHCIALLLELVNHVGLHAADVRLGNWQSSPSFSYFMEPLTELLGKTLGIVGLGAIGTQVGRIGAALGMRVIAHTRAQRPDAPFPLVALDDVLTQSDVVSVHCPLSEATHHLFNRTRLAQMKRGALLINGARGPIVDEAALAEALFTGHLGGAATDVLCAEPPHGGSPLLSAPRCIVTPHIAWASVEARQRLLAITAENVAAFLRGEPRNVVCAE